MSETNPSVPVWYWIVGAAALLWNIIGVVAFISLETMSAEAIAAMPEAEQALLESAPVWSTIAYTIAVFGGAFGSLFLLLRKNLAMMFFIASLAGIIVQFTYWLFMTEAVAVYGAQEAYMMPALVTLIAIALIWFTNMAKGKGWLR